MLSCPEKGVNYARRAFVKHPSPGLVGDSHSRRRRPNREFSHCIRRPLGTRWSGGKYGRLIVAARYLAPPVVSKAGASLYALPASDYKQPLFLSSSRKSADANNYPFLLGTKDPEKSVQTFRSLVGHSYPEFLDFPVCTLARV